MITSLFEAVVTAILFFKHWWQQQLQKSYMSCNNDNNFVIFVSSYPYIYLHKNDNNNISRNEGVGPSQSHLHILKQCWNFFFFPSTFWNFALHSKQTYKNIYNNNNSYIMIEAVKMVFKWLLEYTSLSLICLFYLTCIYILILVIY